LSIHTTNCFPLGFVLFTVLIQVTFPPDFFLAYTMCLITVQFRQADTAILETNSCNALQLAPPAASVRFAQSRQLADQSPHGYPLKIRSVTDDLEFHAFYTSENRDHGERVPKETIRH